jgi:hypothetical protein
LSAQEPIFLRHVAGKRDVSCLEEIFDSLPEVIEREEDEFYELDIRRINGKWIVAYRCLDEPDMKEIHTESNNSLCACADQMYIWLQKHGYI